jgi:adenylosuccinate lyase
VNEERVKQDLESAWEVLGEPIQTVMRRYGIPKPYEKMKELTRGKSITKEDLHTFIQNLELPKNVKDDLLQLTPEKYVGLAPKLAELASTKKEKEEEYSEEEESD